MKRYFRSLAVGSIVAGAIVTGATQSAHAASATSDAQATVIAAIAIAKTVDLDFASIVPVGTQETVIVSPAGLRTCGGTLTCAGTVAAASFDVTGGNNLTYSITLPGSALTINSGGDNMSVDTFTSTPTPTGTLNGSGAETLLVGATLTVGANQAAGTYGVGDTFSVTVDYN